MAYTDEPTLLSSIPETAQHQFKRLTEANVTTPRVHSISLLMNNISLSNVTSDIYLIRWFSDQ